MDAIHTIQLWAIVGDYFEWWTKQAKSLCRLVCDCSVGCLMHLLDKIERTWSDNRKRADIIVPIDLRHIAGHLSPRYTQRSVSLANIFSN